VMVSAADANGPGDRYATRHAELATAGKVTFERLRPPEGLDWNDVLTQGRGA
jgi:DNA-binding transcriptional regulator YdaS (Cro superfamily)